MKYGYQFLIFLMAFQLEVRVRASAEYLEQPSRCLQGQESCAIQSIGEAFHLNQKALKIHAEPDSLLVRHSPQSWRMIKGGLWVEQGDDFEVETLFGNVRSATGGFWVLDKEDQILIRNVGGADVRVTLRDGKSLDLPDGFQFWISGLNSQGVSEYGMLEPIDIADHLARWNALYPGTKEDFLKEAKLLKQKWPLLVEKSSFIYKTLAERKIASVADQLKKEREQQERLAEERKRLKQLYHQRVFER